MSLWIDNIIELRNIIQPYMVHDNGPLAKAINDDSWHGMCQEILEALHGDDSHHVERVDGRFLIWRISRGADGGRQVIGMPVFIQAAPNTWKFVSTIWKFPRYARHDERYLLLT